MKGKRVLAILTSLVLTVGTLSVGAYAADGGGAASTTGKAAQAAAEEAPHVHKMEIVAAVEARCEQDGNIEYYICPDCGKLFADEFGEKELQPEEIVVKATGHKYPDSGKGEVTKQPTEEAPGVMTYKCQNEGCDSSYTEEIPQLEKQEKEEEPEKAETEKIEKTEEKEIEEEEIEEPEESKKEEPEKSVKPEGEIETKKELEENAPEENLKEERQLAETPDRSGTDASNETASTTTTTTAPDTSTTTTTTAPDTSTITSTTTTTTTTTAPDTSTTNSGASSSKIPVEEDTEEKDDKNKSEYNLWIAGTPVTKDNKNEIKFPKVSGTMTFDSTTNTLTINAFEAKIAQGSALEAFILYTGERQLNIALKGKNRLTCSLDNGRVICVVNSSLEIVGTKSDSLTIINKGVNGEGIFARKTITFNGGTVTATGVASAIKSDEEKIVIKDGTLEVIAETKVPKETEDPSTVKIGPAVWASKDFSIDDTLEIVEPEGGKYDIKSKTVIDTNDKEASKVIVSPVNNHTHEWGEVTYSWEDDKSEVTATRICKLCKEEESETVRTKVETTVEATCVTSGKKTYTAVFKNEELGSDTKTEEIPATGHSWGDVDYTWSSDNMSCTAKVVCKNCKEENTEQATVKKTSTATCEADGTATYTAKFAKNTSWDTEKKVEEKALGHDWQEPKFEWTDSTHAKVTRTCARDSSHTKSEDAKVTGTATLPTKNENGKVTYTATVTIDGKEYTDTKEEAVEPAGSNKGYKFTVKPESWTKRTTTTTANTNNKTTVSSSNTLSFTIKRDKFDVLTYSAFLAGSGVQIDGKKLENKNNSMYTAKKGSLILTFTPAYLGTLSAGSHTLKVNFKDGSVDTKFTVKGTSSTNNNTTNRTTNTTNRTVNSPRTGDYSNWAVWIGLIAVSVIGIGAIVYFKKRGKKSE